MSSMRKLGMNPTFAFEYLMMSHISLMPSTGRFRNPGTNMQPPKAYTVMAKIHAIA